jgi:hypothetical protein
MQKEVPEIQANSGVYKTRDGTDLSGNGRNGSIHRYFADLPGRTFRPIIARTESGGNPARRYRFDLRTRSVAFLGAVHKDVALAVRRVPSSAEIAFAASARVIAMVGHARRTGRSDARDCIEFHSGSPEPGT